MSTYASVIAARSRLTLADTLYIIETAPRRYKVYSIPKKSGGERLIAHPSRELKLIQRSLIDVLDDALPVHTSATAYEKGSSIFKNAKKHAGKDWLIKLDIKNFFNSVHPEHFDRVLEYRNIDIELREISKKAFFWRPRQSNHTCLSVGAPSSPFVVNRLMFEFDDSLDMFCKERGIEFSRYADDLAFSRNEEMNFGEIVGFVGAELAKVGGLVLNQNKCRQIGPGSRKQVTGLILSNDGRVTLGRTQRRRIEARVFNFVSGAEDNVEQVRGHLAFLKMANRSGYDRLKDRFGEREIAQHQKLFS